ncbi:amidohydrolase [Virgibacillus salexigens]|uniref:N-substituted formamide deformylase n=1 Tax=Virgibacillus massiliensis TaxID=1462526 RepID=A0A024QHD6_9BACI|nr:amidohydrolase [Virgibacillus massiliensis]CDQ41610.1 N-substituted formamide deformylase precursor [Virgibacillus massiliensis]
MKKLYYGGEIITMEKDKEPVEAVLVEDGVIQDLGSLSKLEPLFQDDNIEKHNLEGNTLLPSFIDPHSHISMVGPVAALCDLSECDNFNEIVDQLKAYIKEKQLKDSDPVIGFGYDHNVLQEAEHPTKEVLNQVSMDRIVIVMHTSGHMGCVNDLALQIAGIDENTKDHEGGTIGRVQGTLEPNGYLEEASMMAMREKLMGDMGTNFAAMMQQGQEMYIKNGITTCQDGATSKEIMQLFHTLADENALMIDVVAYPLVMETPTELLEQYKRYAKKYSNRFKLGGYKLFLDGSPQGKTAWLTEPYEGETDYKGYAWYQDEEVRQFALTAINDDVQLLTHCNGDAASDQLLRSYANALQVSTNPNKHKLRPVMIHCQTVRDDQLDEMLKLDMIPSIFNVHTYYWGDVHLKNLGAERGSRISPAKTAFDKGLAVNFHQDSPVVKPDMLHAIWCAVNRKTRSGSTIGEQECVTVYEALQAVTINAAYQYFEENTKGSIAIGKYADLVILDQNPLTANKEEINKINVLETIKEGSTIYQKNET